MAKEKEQSHAVTWSFGARGLRLTVAAPDS